MHLSGRWCCVVMVSTHLPNSSTSSTKNTNSTRGTYIANVFSVKNALLTLRQACSNHLQAGSQFGAGNTTQTQKSAKLHLTTEAGNRREHQYDCSTCSSLRDASEHSSQDMVADQAHTDLLGTCHKRLHTHTGSSSKQQQQPTPQCIHQAGSTAVLSLTPHVLIPTPVDL